MTANEPDGSRDEQPVAATGERPIAATGDGSPADDHGRGPTTTVADSGDFAPRPEFSPKPGPMRFEPADTGDGRLPQGPDAHREDGSMLDHVTQFGWSDDASEFLLCWHSGGEFPICRFQVAGGRAETPDTDGEDAHARVQARIAKAGFTPGPTRWDYGELTITWVADDSAKRVHFGVEFEEQAVEDVVTLNFASEFPEDEPALHAEVVSLSRDGTQLAFVAHGWLGEYSDTFQNSLWSAPGFVAKAYTKLGFRHLQAERFVEASAMFERAAAVQPEAWKHPFNMACARARGTSGDARAPLTHAVELGGDAVREKAKTDADLESLRGEAWFVELTGE